MASAIAFLTLLALLLLFAGIGVAWVLDKGGLNVDRLGWLCLVLLAILMCGGS